MGNHLLIIGDINCINDIFIYKKMKNHMLIMKKSNYLINKFSKRKFLSLLNILLYSLLQ